MLRRNEHRIRLHCPFCYSTAKEPTAPLRSLESLQRHLSVLHPTEGIFDSEVARYTTAVLDAAWASAVAQPSDLCDELCVLSGAARVASPLSRGLVIVIDIANYEHQSKLQLYEMLRSDELRRFLEEAPVTIVAVHEMFLHTSLAAHVVIHHLASLHPASRLFVLYAVTRAEAGDLMAARVFERLMCPTIGAACEKRFRGAAVLLTADRNQKESLLQRFSGCNVGVTRSVTLDSLMHSLRAARRAASHWGTE
jgi:hypothetical protein